MAQVFRLLSQDEATGTTPFGLEEAHRDPRISPQSSMRLQRNSDGP
jgi:hypothetical protein